MLNSKIVFWSLLFVTLVCTHTQAQGLRYGVKGGVNVSDFSLRTNALAKGVKNLWKPAILSNVGGFIEKPVNRKLSFQAELLYSINGNNAGLFKASAHYLSIPVLLNIYLHKKLVLELGPQASFTHKSKKSFLNSRADLGIAAGCRVSLYPSVNVGLRYTQGLAPISNFVSTVDSKGNVKTLRDFNSRYLQLLVAYQISKH